jgi:hypothetical protein
LDATDLQAMGLPDARSRKRMGPKVAGTSPWILSRIWT